MQCRMLTADIVTLEQGQVRAVCGLAMPVACLHLALVINAISFCRRPWHMVAGVCAGTVAVSASELAKATHLRNSMHNCAALASAASARHRDVLLGRHQKCTVLLRRSHHHRSMHAATQQHTLFQTPAQPPSCAHHGCARLSSSRATLVRLSKRGVTGHASCSVISPRARSCAKRSLRSQLQTRPQRCHRLKPMPC